MIFLVLVAQLRIIILDASDTSTYCGRAFCQVARICEDFCGNFVGNLFGALVARENAGRGMNARIKVKQHWVPSEREQRNQIQNQEIFAIRATQIN